MASSETEFKTNIRSFTGVSEAVVDADSFSSVLDDAKRHVKIRANISDADEDWYGNPRQEEALSWATKLFLKVAAGELDSNTVQVGAIDHESLLSREDGQVTIWVRNLDRALKRIEVGNGYGIVSSERRTYGDDEADVGGGGLSL
jgi:hypothetical protein